MKIKVILTGIAFASAVALFAGHHHRRPKPPPPRVVVPSRPKVVVVPARPKVVVVPAKPKVVIPTYNWAWYGEVWAPSYDGWFWVNNAWVWGGKGPRPRVVPAWRPDPRRKAPPPPPRPRHHGPKHHGPKHHGPRR